MRGRIHRVSPDARQRWLSGRCPRLPSRRRRWWLAWFGLTPLLLVVRAAATAREGGVRAWWGLAGYVLVTQYWLLPSAGPLLAVLAAGLGALWVPWGWAAHRLLSDPSTLRGTLAAVAPSRRALGFARRVAVESARHAGVGLPRRGVADKFPARCDQYRGRRGDPSRVGSSRWR